VDTNGPQSDFSVDELRTEIKDCHHFEMIQLTGSHYHIYIKFVMIIILIGHYKIKILSTTIDPQSLMSI
jgi:hypothetical protein